MVTDYVSDAVGRQPFHTIKGHEQRLTVRVNQQLRPDVVQVTLQPPQRPLPHSFESDELAPDADLALQFQAISHMAPEQQQVIKQLLEGMIIKYEAERWSSRVK